MSDSPSPVGPARKDGIKVGGTAVQQRCTGGCSGLSQALGTYPNAQNVSLILQNPFYELWDPTNPATTKAFQLDNNFLSNTKWVTGHRQM
eukprot:XP_001697836.1 predicted protein [Chlamydomonas reinhardtii]